MLCGKACYVEWYTMCEYLLRGYILLSWINITGFQVITVTVPEIRMIQWKYQSVIDYGMLLNSSGGCIWRKNRENTQKCGHKKVFWAFYAMFYGRIGRYSHIRIKNTHDSGLFWKRRIEYAQLYLYIRTKHFSGALRGNSFWIIDVSFQQKETVGRTSMIFVRNAE